MHIITRQEGALNKVAKYFKDQRYWQGEWFNKQKDIDRYNSLVVLGTTPNKADVDAIMANTTWTEFLCDDCHKDAEYLIAFRDGKTVVKVCKRCVVQALRLINKEENKK